MSGAASPQRVITAPNEVVIRNSSLRDLIAIAYGVERWRVVGGPAVARFASLRRARSDAGAGERSGEPRPAGVAGAGDPTTGVALRPRDPRQPALPVTLRQDWGFVQRDELTAMLAGLVDHLWQSAWICGAITLLAFISRHDFAPLRLWMWRIAALKFVFPFAFLVAVGEWLGFPVKYPDDPAPAALLEASRAIARFVSPARVHGWSSWRLLLATLAAVLLTVSCVRWIQRQLQFERERALEEARRLERDPDDIVRRPGFFNSALLTACAMLFVALPLLAGALEDRQRHYELLVSNAQLAARGGRDHDAGRARNGDATSRRRRCRRRSHPQCDHPGARRHRLRRHSLLRARRSLLRRRRTGLAHRAAIRRARVWPRVRARKFDPFALRARITRLLAERHGLEIYVDSKCQPPCGKYGVAMPADPL